MKDVGWTNIPSVENFSLALQESSTYGAEGNSWTAIPSAQVGRLEREPDDGWRVCMPGGKSEEVRSAPASICFCSGAGSLEPRGPPPPPRRKPEAGETRVVSILDPWKMGAPGGQVSSHHTSQRILQGLVGPLCLSITLRVITRKETRHRPELLASVRHNIPRKAMKMEDMLDQEIPCLCGSGEFGQRHEMGGLQKTIHHH